MTPPKSFSEGIGHSCGPGNEEKCSGTCNYKPEGKWDQQTDQMKYSHRVVIPHSEALSALSRGTLKRKEGRNTVHFTADSENIELVMSTIHSANQLGIYGAVSTLCVDLCESMHGRVSIGVNMSISEENEQLSQQLDPQEVGSLARSSRRTRSRGKLLARTLKKSTK